MCDRRITAAALLLAVSSGCAFHFRDATPPESAATGNRNPLLSQPGFRFQSHVRSWRSQQQENVVIQQHDYSCGAAALATIFKYYFGDDVPETKILDTITASLKEDEIKDRVQNGLSLNDLFTAAKTLGYQAAAVRLPVEKLKELPAPVLVRIEQDKYKHFVIVRGVVEDRVLLADPIRGQVQMPAHKFLEYWSGEALILGKRGFGLPKDFPLAIKPGTRVHTEEAAARRFLYRRP